MRALVPNLEDQSIALDRKGPVITVQCELEFAAVRRHETAVATLVLHVEPHQRSQILRTSARGPVDPAGIQLCRVELEPVESDHLLLHFAVALAQQPAAIPIEVPADEHLIVDIARGPAVHVEAAVADGAAVKLVAFPGEQQIAGGRRGDVAAAEQGEQIRAQIQMNPRPWLDECEQVGTHAVYWRLCGLELHEELPPQAVGIVVKEFLEVQDVRPEPRQRDGCNHGAYAPLATLGPGADGGVVAEDDLLAGIAYARPELLQSVDVGSGGCPGRQSQDPPEDDHAVHRVSAGLFDLSRHE